MQDERQKPLDIAIGVDEFNKIVIEVTDGNEEVILRFHHEAAAAIAEGILIKVAEVELQIEDAVERMVELG